MAVDNNRRHTTAGLRPVEARPPMHRGAEARRTAPSLPTPTSEGGKTNIPSAACGGGKGAGRGRGAAPAARPGVSGWWRIANSPLRAMQSRWVRRVGIGLVAVAAIFVAVAGGLWLMLASG